MCKFTFGVIFVYSILNSIVLFLTSDGMFEKKCNKELVELLPLQAKEDVELVQNLIQELVDKTGSEIGSKILQNWTEEMKKFVKVFPYDYQQALKTKAKEEMVVKQEKSVSDIEDLVLEDNVSDLNKLDKVQGFKKYGRIKTYYKKVEERIDKWDEIYDFKAIADKARVQATRCMDCGVPFCQSTYGCPLGNIIPRWNELVHQDDWYEALQQLLQTNNFPEFTGRVCPAPCEGACTLGITSPPVSIKTIEVSIIERGFKEGWIIPKLPEVRTGWKVAIVGSGPAGLACADQLNKSGHSVVVFERQDRIGGLLQYGIPTMKLSKQVIDRRVSLMTEEGIVFRVNTSVGSSDYDANSLMKDFHAVCLTTGATMPRDLPIKGRQLKGIHFAWDFLKTSQQHLWETENKPTQFQINAEGKNVVVIGGGDTGCDCIGTSIRQGAKSVVAFEILPRPSATREADNPWPQWPKIYRSDYGHEEVDHRLGGGDPRIYGIDSKEFLDDGQGSVKGIRTVRIKWTRDNESGKWIRYEEPDSEKIYPADLVLLAMGFLGPEAGLLEQLKLQKDERSNIAIKEVGHYETSVRGIFAAGDCRRGQSLVVHALNEGRQAAREIDVFLHAKGKTGLPGPGGMIPWPPPVANLISARHHHHRNNDDEDSS